MLLKHVRFIYCYTYTDYICVLQVILKIAQHKNSYAVLIASAPIHYHVQTTLVCHLAIVCYAARMRFVKLIITPLGADVIRDILSQKEESVYLVSYLKH